MLVARVYSECLNMETKSSTYFILDARSYEIEREVYMDELGVDMAYMIPGEGKVHTTRNLQSISRMFPQCEWIMRVACARGRSLVLGLDKRSDRQR